MNPKTGRLEVVFVDLRQVYPNHDDPMSVEYSFEELRARHRGWLDYDWAGIKHKEQDAARLDTAPVYRDEPSPASTVTRAPVIPVENSTRPQTVPLKGSIDDENDENDENLPPSQAEIEKARLARKARREERANRTRKIKVMEVREIRGETQTSMHKFYACRQSR